MRKINISYFILTFIISFCVLFTFNTIVAAKTLGNLHNFANDNGDGFLKDPPKKFEKGFWLKLNDKQKEELLAAIKKLKSEGATREEIKAEINVYLEKWGIDIKKKFEKGFWLKLNDQQKEELLTVIKELKSKGATREEIKAEINEYLKKWGIKRKKP